MKILAKIGWMAWENPIKLIQLKKNKCGLIFTKVNKGGLIYAQLVLLKMKRDGTDPNLECQGG